MEVVAKLQLKPGQTVFVAGQPPDLELDLGPRTDRLEAADAALLFCMSRSSVERWRSELALLAREDRLVWVAYPKARQLETDLNRDSLARMLQDDGVRPVRQVALDDTWSALRFRRA